MLNEIELMIRWLLLAEMDDESPSSNFEGQIHKGIHVFVHSDTWGLSNKDILNKTALKQQCKK